MLALLFVLSSPCAAYILLKLRLSRSLTSPRRFLVCGDVFLLGAALGLEANVESYAKELFNYINESREKGKVKEPKTVLAKKEVSIGNDSF